ncbi:MAG: altronate dehydratase family protein [Paracoccaceae bacterium]
MNYLDNKTLLLHGTDNVVVSLCDIAAGEPLLGGAFILPTAVPAGHKICIKPVSTGAPIRKYGQIIGEAKTEIAVGEHVHTHNLGMGDHKQDYDFSSSVNALLPARDTHEFMGFLRDTGKVGTRNYIGILTSVNCSGSVARFIAEATEREGWLENFGNVDGVVPIVHSTGCGMSGKGEGYDTLFRTLAGYAQNPNFGAILLVGLGCEVMQISDLVGHKKLIANPNFRYITIQQSGGTRKTVEQGVVSLKELAAQANKAVRTPQPVSSLVVGLQCGGSDGYSGITANPALGVTSDLLVQQGGTTILSETSEIYGAEHLLTRRALTPKIGEDLIDRVKWWEDYCARNFSEMDNNPSPGNKRGGLTTILEKSLGAVSKGGTAPLTAVYKYAEPITSSGFVFMDSPGYDPCSVTGQIASGANMIVFTTGRGSVSGYKPSPCIKIASNSSMYSRMAEDMDVNCGDVVEDGASIEDKGREIYQLILDVASGRKTKSEDLGFGGVEFVPWQIGAVM